MAGIRPCYGWLVARQVVRSQVSLERAIKSENWRLSTNYSASPVLTLRTASLAPKSYKELTRARFFFLPLPVVTS